MKFEKHISSIKLTMLFFNIFFMLYFLLLFHKKRIFPISNNLLAAGAVLLLIICNLLTIVFLFYIEKTKKYKLSLLYDKETGCYTQNTFQSLCNKHIFYGKHYEIIILELSFFDVSVEKENNDKKQLFFDIAKILKQTTPEEGICGRLSLNQFGILLRYEKQSDVKNILQSITNNLKQLPYENFSYTFSICKLDPKSPNLKKAIQNAMLSLQTKEYNFDENCTMYSPRMVKNFYEKQYLQQQLIYAIQKKEFRLYLQPKFDLETNSCIGAEALVRWYHPQKGMLSPDNFIPLLEEKNLIYQVDYFLWEETCKIIQYWECNGYIPVPVSINITKSEMERKPLNHLNSLLFKYHISVNQLELELTEDIFSSQKLSIILAQIHQMKRYGYTICMDDFGSGFSSLNQLKNCDIDIIKIDKAFLNGIDEKNRTATITLEHIISLIQDLKLEMVVEGIETEMQKDFLLSHGCKIGQGYLFSKPIPAEQFFSFLRVKK